MARAKRKDTTDDFAMAVAAYRIAWNDLKAAWTAMEGKEVFVNGPGGETTPEWNRYWDAKMTEEKMLEFLRANA